MNKRQTKKLQKQITEHTASEGNRGKGYRKSIPAAVDLGECKSEQNCIPGPSKVFVTRNSHNDYPYALVDKNHKLIANLVKLSDARNHYKKELKDNTIEIVRDLEFTYGA